MKSAASAAQSQTTMFRVITALKATKKGLTAAEVLKKTSIHLSPDMENELRQNEHIQFDPSTKRYQFKFRHNINGPDDLLQILEDSARETPGVLVIDNDVQTSYPDIDEDVEVLRFLILILIFHQALHSEHKIYIVKHATSKKQIIYHSSFEMPDDLPWTLPIEVKEQWNKVGPKKKIIFNFSRCKSLIT